MLTNEDIVRRYRKSQQTGKWNANRESWLRKLSDKLMYGKMPRLGNNTNNSVQLLSPEILKNGFKNQVEVGPIRGIFGTALGTMLGGAYDAVNIPVQGYRNAYNAAADFYNAGASERNKLNQEAIELNNAQELLRENNKNTQGNGLGSDVSPYVDNNVYGLGNQALLDYISSKVK